MKSLLMNTALLLFTFFATAQNKLSLKEAIETGIKNNIDVLQADLQMQKEGVNYRQSKATMLPDLNASANYGINQGRSIDPFTNSFINQKVNYSNYGANSSILLFKGSSLHNQIKSNELGYEASRLELQQAKDNLTINIILAFLQVLSAEDVLKQSNQQVEVTRKQTDRLEILNRAGSVLPSDYYDLKGQLASDEIAIVDHKAALETARINLAQLLDIPYDKNLEVERLPEENFNNRYTKNPDDVYQTALQHFAQVKASKLRTESAEKNISSIKGMLFPTLSLSGNVNTNYSSAATRDYFMSTGEEPSSNYVLVNGTQLPVIVKKDNYDSRKITFKNQLSNNLFSTINVGLSIPLFNTGRIRNQVKLAKLDFKNNKLIELHTKTQLQQSIERAYVNLLSASDKFTLLKSQVGSFVESFRSTEIRFNAGAITSVDYLIAKNNFDRANDNLIIAKYDFVLRETVLDYYEGKTLW
ncbi:MAG: TolC family protein [Ginsengibacter sp.]